MAHYFSNEKAWMRTEIMEEVVRLLDRKVQNVERSFSLSIIHLATLKHSKIILKTLS